MCLGEFPTLNFNALAIRRGILHHRQLLTAARKRGKWRAKSFCVRARWLKQWFAPLRALAMEVTGIFNGLAAHPLRGLSTFDEVQQVALSSFP
jgi:hypothetical protein